MRQFTKCIIVKCQLYPPASTIARLVLVIKLHCFIHTKQSVVDQTAAQEDIPWILLPIFKQTLFIFIKHSTNTQVSNESAEI